jgi:hypothetical protein
LGVYPQPLITVRNVKASSAWYRRLLACASEMEHAPSEYRSSDRLLAAGRVILELRAYDGPVRDPMEAALASGEGALPPGHGVVLRFLVADFAAAIERVHALEVDIIADVFTTPDGTRNLMVCDPDGYLVVLSGA